MVTFTKSKALAGTVSPCPAAIGAVLPARHVGGQGHIDGAVIGEEIPCRCAVVGFEGNAGGGVRGIDLDGSGIFSLVTDVACNVVLFYQYPPRNVGALSQGKAGAGTDSP